MKTKVLLTLSILSSPLYALANDPYNDFLMAAQSDVNAVAYDNASLPEMNKIGSWIENAQFRFNSGTPANNIDIKKNALVYELRLEPKAWGQRAIEKEILKLRNDQQSNSYNQLFNSALQKRYIRLLDYFELRSKLRYLLGTAEVLTQETGLLQSQVASEQFNPGKLLDTEEALKQNHSLVKLYLIRLNTLQSELGFPLDTTDSIKTKHDTDWLVNVTEIHQLLSAYTVENKFVPDVLNAQLKLKLSQSENKLIKAKQQLGVNLLTFEYGDRKNDELAFQIGINIPLGTSFDDIKNQNTLYTAQSQLNTSIVNTKQLLNEISREVAWLAENSKLIRNQIKRGGKNLQADYTKNNPFLMISLRKTIIDNKQKIANINRDALSLYVSHLALSGQLVQHPLRNWIQQGTPLLTQEKDY